MIVGKVKSVKNIALETDSMDRIQELENEVAKLKANQSVMHKDLYATACFEQDLQRKLRIATDTLKKMDEHLETSGDISKNHTRHWEMKNALKLINATQTPIRNSGQESLENKVHKILIDSGLENYRDTNSNMFWFLVDYISGRLNDIYKLEYKRREAIESLEWIKERMAGESTDVSEECTKTLSSIK